MGDLEIYTPGEVVMAIVDKGFLRKGRLYRVLEQVPDHHAYVIEGQPDEIDGVWGSRFARVHAPFSTTGPICRTNTRQPIQCRRR